MQKAWELLSDRNKWTQGDYAQDANGRSCNTTSDDACAWCAVGAILKCYGTDFVYPMVAAQRVALGLLRGEQRAAGELVAAIAITHVNDCLGYDAVMQVLKAADV